MSWQLPGVAQVNIRFVKPLLYFWQLPSQYKFCAHNAYLVQAYACDLVLVVTAVIPAGSVPGTSCCFFQCLDSRTGVQLFCVGYLHYR